jgi:hypothetical protein
MVRLGRQMLIRGMDACESESEDEGRIEKFIHTSEAGCQYYVAWLKLVLSCFVRTSSYNLLNNPLVINRASLDVAVLCCKDLQL